MVKVATDCAPADRSTSHAAVHIFAPTQLPALQMGITRLRHNRAISDGVARDGHLRGRDPAGSLHKEEARRINLETDHPSQKGNDDEG